MCETDLKADSEGAALEKDWFGEVDLRGRGEEQWWSIRWLQKMELLWFTQTLVTYTCVVSPANPDASGRGWARLPSSLSLALHPSGVCRCHLDIFIKKTEACTHMQIHTQMYGHPCPSMRTQMNTKHRKMHIKKVYPYTQNNTHCL